MSRKITVATVVTVKKANKLKCLLIYKNILIRNLSKLLLLFVHNIYQYIFERSRQNEMFYLLFVLFPRCFFLPYLLEYVLFERLLLLLSYITS